MAAWYNFDKVVQACMLLHRACVANGRDIVTDENLGL